MIEQGTDGLSRDVHLWLSLEGMVPLHLRAMERSPGLEDWIRAWWNTGRNLEVMDP
jgi:hypothetical protein